MHNGYCVAAFDEESQMRVHWIEQLAVPTALHCIVFSAKCTMVEGLLPMKKNLK